MRSPVHGDRFPPFSLTCVFHLTSPCMCCRCPPMYGVHFPLSFPHLISFFLFPSFFPSVSSPYFSFPQFHFLLACVVGALLCMVLIFYPFPSFFFPLSGCVGDTFCAWCSFFSFSHFLSFPPLTFSWDALGEHMCARGFCFILVFLLVFLLCSDCVLINFLMC